MKPAFAFLTIPSAMLLLACSKPADSASNAPTPPPVDMVAEGLKGYTANCATCHQVDGYGVSNMQPPLVDSDVAKGDPTLVIKVVLKGPAAVLPKDRPHYSNVMPAFDRLSDEQIAEILTYVRHEFNHDTPGITPYQVKTVRNQM